MSSNLCSVFYPVSDYDTMSKSLQTTPTTLKQVADGLCQAISADIRDGTTFNHDYLNVCFKIDCIKTWLF